MNFDAMLPGLLILLGVIGGLLLLFLVVMGINSFKDRFDRNFFFTGTSFGLLLGEGLLLSSSLLTDGWTKYGDFTDMLTFDLMLGSPSHAYTPPSWNFYFGLIILLIAWITNIRKSSFWWGMYQNIVQGAVVLVFSVIIIIGAMLIKDKVKR